MRKTLILITFFFVGLYLNAQNSATLVINDTTGAIINRNIYGHFAEHLGRCIYDGFYRNGKIRMDIVEAMKRIKMPLLRWPGGCFADQYHWRDGIGNKKKRPVTVNTQWGMVTDDNSFGTHEFLELCELIGCEPYIAGNVGTGTPQEMQNWIEYLNYDGPSTLAKLRGTNGHPQPYHIKYWGVGNESWGCGGRMTAEDYANKYREFAGFCKSYPGSPLKRIVSGAQDDDYHWTETMMRNIPWWLMQGVGVHYYTLVDGEEGKGPATGFTEEQYFKGLKNALRMKEIVEKHAAIMDRYDPEKRVALIVDEWGISLNQEPGTNPYFLYQQNSMRDALIAASTLNIFNNHCDRVRMANLAQSVNVLQALILTEGEKMLLTPTYYVFDLYKVHQDAKWLPVKIESPYYRFGKDSIQSVNVSASVDSQKVTHITLVNLDPRQEIPVVINPGNKNFSSIDGQVLASGKYTDFNTFDNPGAITVRAFSNFQQQGGSVTVNMPPNSVVMLELK